MSAVIGSCHVLLSAIVAVICASCHLREGKVASVGSLPEVFVLTPFSVSYGNSPRQGPLRSTIHIVARSNVDTINHVVTISRRYDGTQKYQCALRVLPMGTERVTINLGEISIWQVKIKTGAQSLTLDELWGGTAVYIESKRESTAGRMVVAHHVRAVARGDLK